MKFSYLIYRTPHNNKLSLTLKYFIFTTYRIIYTRFILHTVTNQQQSTIHLKKKKKTDYQSNRKKFW